MRRRIFTGGLWVMLVALVLSALFSSFMLQRRMQQQAEKNLRILAETLAVSHYDVDDFVAEAKELSALTGMRVTFVSLEGEVLADSMQRSYDVVDVLEREEFVQASVGTVGFVVQNSSTLGRRVMYAAVLTQHGYYLRLSSDAVGFGRGLVMLLPGMLLLAVLLAFILVPISRRVSGSISSPIGDFSASLGKVMDGGEKLDPERYPYEELRSMALSINELSHAVDEAILRTEKERQRIDTILDSMKEGFLMLDWNDNVLLVNNTACRILQYVPDDENKNLLHVTRDIDLIDAVAEVKKTGTMRHVEYEGVGGKRYEVAVSPSAEGDDARRGIVIFLSDIADFQTNARIRQEFFQSASHELKTPITSVRGFAEILQSGAVQEEAVRAEYAERIIKEVRRMETLIEEILMIARMESGELRYEREDMDLYTVVRECCEDVAAMAEQAGVEVSCEGAPCRIYASPKQMVELVGNLVTNAVKYNKPGEGRVSVNLWMEDGSAVLSVFNTGEAISETQKERIFERFYRIDKGRTRAVGGTGLGLAIVKHICGVYGAKVSVIPQPGVGNTFQVVFPPSLGAMLDK